MNGYQTIAILIAVILAFSAGMIAYTSSTSSGESPKSFLEVGATWTVKMPTFDFFSGHDYKGAQVQQYTSAKWYIQGGVDSFKFQSENYDATLDSYSVEEYHGGKKYTYRKLNVPHMLSQCQSCSSDIVNELNAMKDVVQDCVATDNTFDQGSLQANVASVKKSLADGNTVWSMGGMLIEASASGAPIAIWNDEDDASTRMEIVSVTPMTAEEKAKVFKGCDPVAQHESAALKKRRRQLVKSRKLGAWTDFQAWASGTNWCGAGTDLDNTPCPVTSSDNGDMACHRHDHGKKANGIIGGMAVRLGCDIDHGLAARTSNWAAQAVFGSWGLAMTWGCYDYGKVYCWNKARTCKWYGCWNYWRYTKHCSEEYTRYGPWRYNGYSHKYGWKAQSRCTTDLSWSSI
jgi:hypothetical protein